MRELPNFRVGITWIDVVVVLAVGVLLVPLVVPVLRDASEQTRIDQCLSNLHVVMRAAASYLDDYSGNFPLYTPTGVAICSWAYGGKTTSDYWKTEFDGAFYVPVTERPLNPYILGAQVQPDRTNGTEVAERTPIRRLQCPSDRVTHQRAFFEPGPAEPLSCYDDVGTSYQFNMHALAGDTATTVSWNGDEDPFTPPGTWADYVQLLARQVLAKHASTFTWLLEDPMDWSLTTHTQEWGNHGEFSKHSAGYLDGHGDYIYRDTRGWCGPGWEAINPSWIRAVGYDPRPASYISLFTNCNPPQGAVVGE